MLPSLDKLHHATIITGNRAGNLVLVEKYLNENGIVIQGNPDVAVFNDDQLTIDTAREIVESVTNKKFSENRFVIISFDRATTEAQNAILKTLEEPQAGTHFFVLVQNTDRILPTILSRSQLVAGEAGAGETRMSAKDFLKATMAGRFELVETWTKDKKTENNLTKSEVIHFIDQLEKVLWESGNKDEQLFTDIRKMREYANINGASHRVLLDYLGMVCPILK